MRTFISLLALSVIACAASASQPLVIHEWGTFTALQDENGVALGRINTDDEPVPPFVHTLSRYILEEGHPLALSVGRRVSEQDLSMLKYSMNKGFPSRHPFVTLRLETPVLYFYPRAGDEKPFNVDVKASFKGGWLTEFYPKASPSAAGLDLRSPWGMTELPITKDTVGSLEWKGLTINASSILPKTDWHVWLAPRNTGAAQLVAASGESEKYLFYRGVGNRSAPLVIREDAVSGRLVVQKSGDTNWERQRVPALWLLDVRADGRAAWRSVTPNANQDETVAELRSDFEEADYRANGVDSLRAQMHLALVKDGLFADEATAMLSTWQRAYFESFGKRVFFIVPRTWTDQVLPLEISVPAQVTRTMVGRIELIGESQRALLKQLRQTPTSDPRWLMKLPYDDSTKKFLSRQTPFSEVTLPAETPPDYKLFMQLGRFRSAIVLNAQEKDPSPQLAEFIKRYGLNSPMAVIDQILYERPAADALLQARVVVQKDWVEGYKALHAVIAEYRGSAGAQSAQRDIAELWQDPAKRAKLDAVRPACLLMLLEQTRDQLCARSLFDRYPNSAEATQAKAVLAQWAREEAERQKAEDERRAAQTNTNK